MQKANAILAIGKQADKDTEATTLAYQHGVAAAGKIISAEPSQDVLSATAASRVEQHVYRDGVTIPIAYQVYAHKASVGLYLLGGWGAVTNGGTEPAYTHTNGVGGALPYYTIAVDQDGDLRKARGCVFNEQTYAWEGNSPLTIENAGHGLVLTPKFTPWVAGTLDETYLDSFLTPVGGAFELAMVGTSTADAEIKSGSVKIANNVEPYMLSGSLMPGGVDIGKTRFEVNLTLRVADLDFWRSILTGDPDGTEVSQVVYGAFEIGFKENRLPASAADLTFTGDRIAWLGEIPDADPAGGEAEVELTGTALAGASGCPIVPVLTNAVATY